MLPPGPLPPPGPKPFFSILDSTLSREIRQQIGRPFWIDTVGRSNFVEIRIQLDDGVLRVFARRTQTYASNSHIFLFWMVGTSLVLLGIAVLFLRNQIRPILRLAEAAESFGKGRDVEFRPRGAREVRQAGHAFIEMRRRIERAIEQRTAMLNGVSHDLRTILTRFKLSLALMDEETPELEALKKDVDEMSRMLEAYLAFARGDAGEQAAPTDMRPAARRAQSRCRARRPRARKSTVSGDPDRHASGPTPSSAASATSCRTPAARRPHRDHRPSRDPRWLTITVDDDGPGIPADQRDEVFKPFLRLDEARNRRRRRHGPRPRDRPRHRPLPWRRHYSGESPLGGLKARCACRSRLCGWRGQRSPLSTSARRSAPRDPGRSASPRRPRRERRGSAPRT